MVWFVIALIIAVGTVWLIRGSKNPGGLVLPSLSIAIALTLVSAFVIWLNEGSGRTGEPAPLPDTSQPLIAADDLSLTDVDVVQGSPRTSYRLTGTLTNNGSARLDSIALTVIMQDCPDDVCTVLAEDTALVLARIPPGATQAVSTPLTFPVPRLGPPQALRWDYRIGDIRASR